MPIKKQTFVSEPLIPVTTTADLASAPTGGPVLPREFVWRKGRLHIATVLCTWRETGPCKHGSAETYVRKHWFEVVTTSHQTARIYFERQPRGRKPTQRWWLFTIEGRQGDTVPPPAGSLSG
jgi:phosphoribosylglycinamide formyltransferase-1